MVVSQEPVKIAEVVKEWNELTRTKPGIIRGIRIFKPIITFGLLGVAMLFSHFFIIPIEPVTAVPLPDITPRELPSMKLDTINKDQLEYHQRLQLFDPHMDYDFDDHLWTPEAILHHKY